MKKMSLSLLILGFCGSVWAAPTHIVWLYNAQSVKAEAHHAVCQRYVNHPIRYHFVGNKVVYDQSNVLRLKDYQRTAALPLNAHQVLYTGHTTIVEKQAGKVISVPMQLSFVHAKNGQRIEGVWSTPHCRGDFMGTVINRQAK